MPFFDNDKFAYFAIALAALLAAGMMYLGTR
jgi:hypothetical protein